MSDTAENRISFDPSPQSNIYNKLAEFQRTESWYGQSLFAELHIWAERLSVELKLDVPKLALRVDPLPVNVLGHFRPGHNGFGLEGEIALNTLYLRDRPVWQILGTLCHELLHAWQQFHGKPSRRDHHNLEFRRKAAEYGLLIDRIGITDYLLDSPFMTLLRKHGVEIPTEAEDEEEGDFEIGRGRILRRLLAAPPRQKGKSKLVKWTCGCTSAWVAKSDFRAVCLKCTNQFVRPENGGQS